MTFNLVWNDGSAMLIHVLKPWETTLQATQDTQNLSIWFFITINKLLSIVTNAFLIG